MLHCGRQRRKPSKSRAKTTVLVLRSREAASKDDPDRFAGRVRAPVRLDWNVLRGSCFARAPQEEGRPFIASPRRGAPGEAMFAARASKPGLLLLLAARIEDHLGDA